MAVDALDEWLQIVEWAQRKQPDEPARDLRRPGSIHLHATDTTPETNAERSEMGVPPPEGWGRVIDLSGDAVVWRRGHEKASVTLRGPVAAVLLAFYSRLPLDSPELEVLGERELLEFWMSRATFG